MIKPSRTLVTALLVAALAIPALVLAGTAAPTASSAAGTPDAAAPSHPGWGHSHGMAGMMKKLNLTQDQKDKIHSIFAAHKDQLAANLKQLQQARAQLSTAIQADKFDEGAVRAASQAVGEAQTELHVMHGQIAAEVRPLLTPDQQAQLKQLMAKHQARADHMLSHMENHLQQGVPPGN